MHARIKKGLRLSAYILGGFLLVLLLSVGALLVWLRTPHADATIANLVVTSAAEQGITLTMGSFSGPLPGHLLVRDIAVADAKGVFFKAEHMEARLNLLALLTGTISIPLVRIDAPIVLRLPELPPGPAEPEQAASASGFSLPFALVVEELVLDRGEAHPPVLYGDSPPKNAQPLRLGLSGNAGIAGHDLSAALNLVATHPGSEYDMFLRLGSAPEPRPTQLTSSPAMPLPDPGEPSPERFTLRVRARDTAGGLLSRLTNNPALPAYALNANGFGTLEKWTLTLDAVAGEKTATGQPAQAGANNPEADAPSSFIAGTNRVASVNAVLNLTRSGTIRGIAGVLSSIWKVDLESTLALGTAAPDNLRALTAPAVTLAAQITADPANRKGTVVTLNNVLLTGKSWQTGLERATITLPAKGGLTLFNATALAAVTDAAGLASSLGMAPPGIQRAEIRADISGHTGTSASANKAAPENAAETSLAVLGKAAAYAEEEQFTLNFGLDAARIGNNALLRRATVNGLGIALDARAEHDAHTGAATVTANLAARDNTPWQQLASRFSGQAIGGSLTAIIDASLAADAKANGTLSVKGENMRWFDEGLQKLLGSSVALAGTVAGGGDAPYTAELTRLSTAGLTASGQAQYAPNAANPSASALKGTLRAALSDTALLAPDISGPVTLEASLSGSVGAPVFALAANSTAIRTPQGAFETLQAKVSGGVRTNADGTAAITATANAAVGASPAGALSFDADIAARAVPGGTTSGSARNVRLTMDGLDLNAEMEGTMPSGSRATPTLNGTASLNVTNWNALAKLTGLPLKGENAGIDVALKGGKDGQNASMTLKAAKLALGGGEDAENDVFRLADLTATLSVDDLFAVPRLTLAANMGAGSAGPMEWGTGTADVRAEKDEGAFSVSLAVDQPKDGAAPRQRGRTNAKAQPRQPRATTPGKPERNERLTLAGSFTRNPMRVTIDRFATRLPESTLGLYLAEPATVDLAQGLVMKGVRVNILPKGAIVCEATLAGQNAEATASITELPLALARFFAPDTPIPDGIINANVTMRKSGASIRGNADLTASIPPVLPPGDKQTALPFVVVVRTSLEATPDPRFSALRTIPGVTRLKGNLSFGPAAGVPASGRVSGTTGSPALPEPALYFDIPLVVAANGVPAPAMNAPAAATLDWQGSIAPLWQALPMPDRSVEGAAKAKGVLSGTLADPVYNAAVYLAGGRFEDKILGVLLRNMEMELTSATKTDTRLVFRATDQAKGTISLEGLLSASPIAAARQASTLVDSAQTADSKGSAATVSRRERASSRREQRGPYLSARGHISRLRPLQRDDLSLTLSGRVSVNGRLAAPVVEAAIEVERGELTLLSSLTSGVRTLEITDPNAKAKPEPKGGRCLVDLSIPNRFFIRGRGLDCEWGGKLHIVGPLASPSLVGNLKPIRGTFDLLSRPFTFSGGEITFLGGDRIDPGLSLELTHNGPSITAIVRAGGRASKPKLTMESRPSLPQDQILAEVLFGKNFSRLSRFEALQVANGVRQLASPGDGGFDIMTSMRKSLGIDMLRVGSSGNSGDSAGRSISGAPGAASMGGSSAGSSGDDQEGTPTVEAGKYINDAIYVGVEQGTTSDSTGVRVEVELMPNLTLHGKSSTKSSTVGLGWKRDY